MIKAIFIAAGLLAWPSMASAQAVEFKGSPLGIRQEQWRALPPPTESAEGLKPTCSGDPGAPKADDRTAAEASLGVLECGYAIRDQYSYWAGGHIGGFEYGFTNYLFLNGALYKIYVVADQSGSAEIRRLLTQKYGQPKVTTGQTVNGLGNTMPAITAVWSGPLGQIVIRSPDLRQDRLTIEMTTNEGRAAVEREGERLNPSKDRI